jgi:hypothetical protein
MNIMVQALPASSTLRFCKLFNAAPASSTAFSPNGPINLTVRIGHR